MVMDIGEICHFEERRSARTDQQVNEDDFMASLSDDPGHVKSSDRHAFESCRLLRSGHDPKGNASLLWNNGYSGFRGKEKGS